MRLIWLNGIAPGCVCVYVYVLLMVVFITSPFSVLKYSKKLVDREKVLDVSDREAHAAEKPIYKC